MRKIYIKTNNKNYILKEYAYLDKDQEREKKFENTILKLSSKIFPKYYCRKINLIVELMKNNDVVEGYAKSPDLVLLSKNLDHWIIVEVETIIDNSFHFASQVETFSRGDYTRYKVSNALIKAFEKDDFIDEEKINKMLSLEPSPRKLLCIFDGNDETFFNICKEKNALIMVFKMFETFEGGKDYALELENLPNFLNYEDDEYELKKDDSILINEEGLLKMYIFDNSDLNNFDSEIIINKATSAKLRSFVDNKLHEVKKDEKGKYVEFSNLNSFHLYKYKIKREKENIFKLIRYG